MDIRTDLTAETRWQLRRAIRRISVVNLALLNRRLATSQIEQGHLSFSTSSCCWLAYDRFPPQFVTLRLATRVAMSGPSANDPVSVF